MQITLELKYITDLEILIPLLKRLEIKIIEQDVQAPAEQSKSPLAKHIGRLPDLDTDAFEKYQKESRNGWKRPTF